jgi:ubiquinone/menaquinone biosynthesis C-methylase UbiE
VTQQLYDGVDSATYNDVVVPIVFEAPARALIESTLTSDATRVLDLATGTGIVARLVAGARPEAMVIGCDASRGMLATASRHVSCPLSQGCVPHLPFVDGTFDVVLASFLINHFSDHKSCLRDMVRVLAPNGQLGVTTWVESASEQLELWSSVAARYVDLPAVIRESTRDIPAASYFSEPGNLVAALEDAKLKSVTSGTHEFKVECSVDEYIAQRHVARRGTIIRRLLDRDAWTRFDVELKDAFGSQYPEGLNYTTSARIAKGRKPAV